MIPASVVIPKFCPENNCHMQKYLIGGFFMGLLHAEEDKLGYLEH